VAQTEPLALTYNNSGIVEIRCVLFEHVNIHLLYNIGTGKREIKNVSISF